MSEDGSKSDDTENQPLTILGQTPADLTTLIHLILRALFQAGGFSAIRLGDGEGMVLAHDHPDMTHDVEIMQEIWFGEQTLETSEWEEIRTGMRDAICSANVIGMPRPFQLNKHHRYRAVPVAVQNVLGDRCPVISDNNFHFYLQWSGALGLIMKQAKRIVVIGCRDLSDDLGRILGLSDVSTVLIRGESKFPGGIRERHWPDGFKRVKIALSKVQHGDLVLVGAGPLGKIYCHLAKEKGAVAIDLGSVLDGWQAVPSREDIHGPIKYLFNLENLLNAPVSAEKARKNLLPIILKTRFSDGFY